MQFDRFISISYWGKKYRIGVPANELEYIGFANPLIVPEDIQPEFKQWCEDDDVLFSPALDEMGLEHGMFQLYSRENWNFRELMQRYGDYVKLAMGQLGWSKPA